MNKKNITILLIILILILGLGFVLMNKEKEQATPPEEVSQEEIDTSDWVTYKSEELGIEFKHPKEWDIHAEGNNYTSFNYSEVYLSVELQLVIFQNPNKKSVYDFYNDVKENKKIEGNEGLVYDWYKLSDDSIKEIYVDNIKSINFISPMGAIENTAVVIPKDNAIIEIQIRGVEEIEKNGKYEVILDTFRFID